MLTTGFTGVIGSTLTTIITAWNFNTPNVNTNLSGVSVIVQPNNGSIGIIWGDNTKIDTLSSTQSVEPSAFHSISHEFSSINQPSIIIKFLLQDSVSNIRYLNLGTSQPNLSGSVNLSTLTGLVSFDGGNNDIELVTGFQGVSGTIEDFKILGNNTISFDLSSLTESTLLRYFAVYGQNGILGDLSSLPNQLISFDLKGYNITTGDISNLPSTLQYYTNFGSNTTFGNLSGLPTGLILYNNNGANTVTGNLTSLPFTVQYFRSIGSNTIDSYYNGNTVGYGLKGWANNMRYIELQPASTIMSESHLATLLVDLTASQWVDEKTIKCDVNNPTVKRANNPIAIQAIDYLRSVGCTVTVLTAET